MRVVIAGDDATALSDAFSEHGVRVVQLAGPVTARDLADASIEETDLFVLTDPSEATAIPLIREAGSDARIVIYADASVPPFATHMADLILSPHAVDRDIVVEELLSEGDR